MALQFTSEECSVKLPRNFWGMDYFVQDKKNKERGRLFLLLFRPMSSVKLRRDFRGMDYSVQKKKQKTQYKHKGKTKQKNKILDNMNACVNNWK
jgi:hypothetical protein